MDAQPTLASLDGFLAGLVAEGCPGMGEVAFLVRGSGYELRHRDDLAEPAEKLQSFSRVEDAEEIARYDDAGTFRPLKTAPNLRHGWRLESPDSRGLRLALEALYPGRLGAFLHGQSGRLPVTPLRETLARQTGMYRVTQKITDEQASALVGRVCRSDGGCARTILWSLSVEKPTALLAHLPAEKFDPARDQILAGRGGQDQGGTTGKWLPMLCQEACNLLVAEARAVVKGTKPAS